MIVKAGSKINVTLIDFLSEFLSFPKRLIIMSYANFSSSCTPAAMALEASVKTEPVALSWMMAMVLERQRHSALGLHLFLLIL